MNEKKLTLEWSCLDSTCSVWGMVLVCMFPGLSIWCWVTVAALCWGLLLSQHSFIACGFLFRLFSVRSSCPLVVSLFSCTCCRALVSLSGQCSVLPCISVSGIVLSLYKVCTVVLAEGLRDIAMLVLFSVLLLEQEQALLNHTSWASNFCLVGWVKKLPCWSVLGVFLATCYKPVRL